MIDVVFDPRRGYVENQMVGCGPARVRSAAAGFPNVVDFGRKNELIRKSICYRAHN